MPIAGMLAAERVNSAWNRQPATDERIRVNVGIIIVVDEVVTESLPENEPRYCSEKNADNCDAVALHFVVSFTKVAAKSPQSKALRATRELCLTRF